MSNDPVHWSPETAERIFKLGRDECDYTAPTSNMMKLSRSYRLNEVEKKVLELGLTLATEYLTCSLCTRKVVAWSQGIVRQLDAEHRYLFPSVLTYK